MEARVRRERWQVAGQTSLLGHIRQLALRPFRESELDNGFFFFLPLIFLVTCTDLSSLFNPNTNLLFFWDLFFYYYYFQNLKNCLAYIFKSMPDIIFLLWYDHFLTWKNLQLIKKMKLFNKTSINASFSFPRGVKRAQRRPIVCRLLFVIQSPQKEFGPNELEIIIGRDSSLWTEKLWAKIYLR